MFFRPMERDASLQMKIVDDTTDYTLAEIVEFDCFAVHIDDLDDGLIAASEQQYMLLRGEGRLNVGTGVYDERVLTFNMLLDSEILGECAYREKITADGTIDSPYDGNTSNAAY